jgi:transcriptional regulator with XRE-family HTH domain
MNGARKIVANNLKALRDVKGVAQEELAVRAGIDRSYISDLENGKYGLSIDKLENLAEALGVEPWEMLHPMTGTNVRKNAGRQS